MKLIIIFKLQAAFAAIWAIQLIFLPQIVFTQYGWSSSMELIALGQACGTAMLSLAIIAYGIPKWTTDEQLNEAAKFFGIVAILFTLMQLYQIIISKSSPGIVMTGLVLL